MHIVLKTAKKEYPKNLSHIPKAQAILEIVEKNFKVWEVTVETNYVFPEGFYMNFHLDTEMDSFVDRLHVEYQDYKVSGESYTMMFSFRKGYNAFSHFYDHESCGPDMEEVFYGLLNGHKLWVDSFVKFVTKGAESLLKKVPAKKRKISKTFHARMYAL